MTQPFRLPHSGTIDRGRALRFSFDGRSYEGYAGDTLASALLANGVHLVGRSFKYHRPRGILGSGIDEPNALVEVDRGHGRRDANIPATTIELYEGLVARSQNRWPSLRFDVGAVNRLLAPAIPAGFYYKTFLWPRGAWAKLFEPAIRRAAGLGRAPDLPDPDRYALRYGHCETLIVGGDRSGIDAAIAASEDRSQRVVLCDEGFVWGGSCRDRAWIDASIATLAARSNVALRLRTTAFAYAGHAMVGLCERLNDHRADAPPGTLRQIWHQMRAGRTIVATGAHERPLVFAGNDLPGIMLAGAVRSYAERFAVVVGRRVVVVVADDSGYDCAEALVSAGAEVTLLELRSQLSRVSAGVEGHAGVAPLRATGRLRVDGLVARLADGTTRRFACDAVAMAGGWTPAVHLFSQAGGKLRWSEADGAYAPDSIDAPVAVVGRAAGREGPAAHRWLPVDPKMAFVDFQNDVTAKDLGLAVREGFTSVEHLKRYTTTGMATDQGRTSNVNAMAIAGEAMGIAPSAVGVTTFRAPYSPTVFGTLAGYDRDDLFDPERRTPIDPWAEARGAVFEPVGLWRRARYFPRVGEDMHAAVARECRTVRDAVGVFDASTLGKIEVVGPDAAEFMDRMYINAWTKLAVGRCRYGLLLRDDGYIYDDGVVGRIADDRFHVTTTTGGAAGVLQVMEDYRQTEWPELDVWLTSTTEQWAVIAVQGPRARDVIAPLVAGIELHPAAFPHMALRTGTIAGVETRLFRVSFTGELGFEINVPAEHARAVWDAVATRVEALGGCAYGTEAMHVLRAEKGFIIVGQDTDGTVTPDDVGMGGMIGKAKRDFVGKRGLMRDDLVADGRKQFVGLIPQAGRCPDEGAQLVTSASPAAFTSEGHVTSAYACATVGHPIALGLLRNGRARLGETVFATALDGMPIACTVTAPVFVDPEGHRSNG